ncbi:MAG TPA: hypothetical protein VMB21_04075 [Candidatus Limnocylindria bacterium]|jgi:hypothetical protein|nr:hypothetical protein [Candidatus Limnocylindria bacterium]
MNSALNPLTGPGRALLALAAGCVAFTLAASEQADFSAPEGKTTSSLTPVRPQDLENDFKKFFDRSASKSAPMDVSPTYGPPSTSQMPVIDSKTRSRILNEWDKKKNWLLNGSAKKEAFEKDKKDEDDPFEEVSGRTRTALEKHILGDDAEGKAEKARGLRQMKKNNEESDPSSAGDQAADEKDPSGTSSRNGPEKEASKAYFSDPFNRTVGDKKKSENFIAFGQKAEKEEVAETPAAASARSSARLEQAFATPNSLTGPAGPSPLAGVADPLSQRSTHLDDLHNILGRDPGSASTVAGILGGFGSVRASLAAPAAAPPSSFSPPVFVPAPAPRRAEPIMQAQPTILPRPVRDF